MTTTDPIARDTVLTGLTTITVTVPENFVVARAMLGEVWHRSYSYQIERVAGTYGIPTFFLKTLTNDRYVYTGVVHPSYGSVRLTRASAFPPTATRVRIANKVLAAIFSGRAEDIERAGWEVEVEVLREDEKF